MTILGQVMRMPTGGFNGFWNAYSMNSAITLFLNHEKETENDPDYNINVSYFVGYVGTGWLRPNSKGVMTVYLRLAAEEFGGLIHAHLEEDRNEKFNVVLSPLC